MPPEVDQSFIQEHMPWMLALARKILADEHLAEDAVQEAFISAHKNLSTFDGRSDIRTWLYRVTLNSALAVQRKRNTSDCDIDELQPLFDANACRIEEPWNQLRTVDEVLEQDQLADFVRQCVDKLPEEYRLCLQLRDFEELSVKQVSDILKITPQNVKVRTHRARSALKKILEPLLRGDTIQEVTMSQPPTELKPSLSQRAKGVMTAYLPGMITCQQFESFIVDYLEDDLSKSKRRLFEFHIRTCRECREYMAAYQRTRELTVATAAQPVDLKEVPEHLLIAVQKTLED